MDTDYSSIRAELTLLPDKNLLFQGGVGLG